MDPFEFHAMIDREKAASVQAYLDELNTRQDTPAWKETAPNPFKDTTGTPSDKRKRSLNRLRRGIVAKLHSHGL